MVSALSSVSGCLQRISVSVNLTEHLIPKVVTEGFCSGSAVCAQTFPMPNHTLMNTSTQARQMMVKSRKGKLMRKPSLVKENIYDDDDVSRDYIPLVMKGCKGKSRKI
jgi:hypothetical protein